MFEYKINEDIAMAEVDLLINASNGIGWMGGKDGIKTRLKGVAESIHFVSKGEVEKLAKTYCKKHSFFGLKPTSTFVTDAPNLNAKSILHCVTMRYPGSKAQYETVVVLVDKLLQMLDEQNESDIKIETIAIPFLGCGTGGVDKELVRQLYEEQFKDRKEKFYIYEYIKTENNGQRKFK
jgi:O-acetyl-ADP-ribose deacetylase (regulator of RNase III)